MDKFLARRVALENLGDSVFDDGIIKSLLQDYMSHMAVLLNEEDINKVKFRQGYLACLEAVILKLRQQKAQEAKRQDNGDND